MLKYLGIKHHDVCNKLSSESTMPIYPEKGERTRKREEADVAKCKDLVNLSEGFMVFIV